MKLSGAELSRQVPLIRSNSEQRRCDDNGEFVRASLGGRPHAQKRVLEVIRLECNVVTGTADIVNVMRRAGLEARRV